MLNNYTPITGVWEITMGCNMRCKHCGSSCESALEGELTLEQAYNVCDQLGSLGFQWITLSGGEPTTRKDWHLIAKRLNDNGVVPTMISNGWLIDEEIADKAKAAGISVIAFSLDGLKETHDYIRKPGSYDRIMKAIDILVKKNIGCSVITTVNNRNIKELDSMHEILSSKGLFGWQLQLGLPMGNMAKNNELVASPHHMDELIDFAHKAYKKATIEIQLADCVGYFNKKEMEVRANNDKYSQYSWNGCGAGKHSIGILHNGDILGCTSIRDREFIEGNLIETPLNEIWNNPDKFNWNRNMSKDKLKGVCSKCQFGNKCFGGCGNTRLTMEGSIYGDNSYCSYNYATKKATEQLEKLTDEGEILAKARKFIANKSYQLAEILLSNVLKASPENLEALSLHGLSSFMLENYEDAKKSNKLILSKNENDPYANKGYGLSLHKLGQSEKGIEYLKKAIELTDKNFMDPYYDLAIVFCEVGKNVEALSILEDGRNLSTEFQVQSEALYQSLYQSLHQ